MTTEQTTADTELPGYVSLPAWLVADVRTRQSPILARSILEDWWVVYVEHETVTTMPEDEWNEVRPPVLRAWDGSAIIYATAE